MDYSFLSPVKDRLVDELELLHDQTIGKKLRIHSSTLEPALDDVKMAVVGVLESRNSVDYIGEEFQFNEIRKAFYGLFPGNWSHEIADLGDIQKGETVEDSYFALIQVVSSLIKEKIIPIIIGGSQDLTYANYRAYDKISSMINIVNIDKSFDLGDSSKPINGCGNNQSLSLVATQFSHANIKLPKKLDYFLSFVLISPDMHKIHHHYQLPYTDANYGNIFSIWDRLLGTYIYMERERIVYGVDTLPNEAENSSLKQLLKQPFQGYRKPTTDTVGKGL